MEDHPKGPRKTILIVDMDAHIAEKAKQDEWASKRDWTQPHCSKCYLRWLATCDLMFENQKRDSWACSGNPQDAVCTDYIPQMKQEILEENYRSFQGFVGLLIQVGLVDEADVDDKHKTKPTVH